MEKEWNIKKVYFSGSDPYSLYSVQFSLFLHPDQAQNTSSGIQGQEAFAICFSSYAPSSNVGIYSRFPNSCVLRSQFFTAVFFSI